MRDALAPNPNAQIARVLWRRLTQRLTDVCVRVCPCTETLPVVPRASRGQIIDVTLKRSQLWAHFYTYHLTENMRIRNAAAAGTDTADMLDFASWLMRLGDGTEPHDDLEMIELPTDRWPELCEPAV